MNPPERDPPERARDVGYLEHADGIPNVQFGPSRPDLGLCIPGSMAESFIGAALPRLTAEDLWTASGIRVVFWKQGPFTRNGTLLATATATARVIALDRAR
jgi:hypothetical protein